jgi:hypothetical protein
MEKMPKEDLDALQERKLRAIMRMKTLPFTAEGSEKQESTPGTWEV